VNRDWEILNKQGQLCAIADAKAGTIPFDNQAIGFVDAAAHQSSSRTVIYCTPTGKAVIDPELLNYALRSGVDIVQKVVR